MASIPTPIPQALADLVAGTWSQIKGGALTMTVWRSFVLLVGFGVLLVVVATGPGFFVAFVIGTILAALYTDDITATIRDIWDMNFWVWRVD